MYKLLTFCFLFILPVIAQTEQDQLNKAQIEEHGSPVMMRNYSDVSDFFRDSTSTWNTLSPATIGFGRAVMGVIGNYVYVFTGQGTTSLAIAYHIPTNSWIPSTPCTASGYNAGFCVAAGELYKCSGTASTAVFEKFTPAGDGTGTWTVLNPGPTSIMNAHNALVWDNGNYIYVYSGSYNNPYPTYLERYNITTASWETKTGSVYNKKYPGMAVIGKYIYLMGGLPAAGQGSFCEKYDTETDTWSSIAPLPEDVNFAKWSVTTDGSHVFLLGSGGGYTTYPYSPNAWYYNPLTDTWAHETLLPAPRGLVHGTYLPLQNKLFWGGGNNTISSSAYQPDIWEGTGGVYVPVELTAFNASVTSDGVELTWETVTEKNNSHFVIERSFEGSSFTNIGVVNGAGTSLSENYYSFIDKNYLNGVCFYRLKQVDYNGDFQYSEVISVEEIVPVRFILEQNYPNPFNPITRIEYRILENAFVSLQVYDPLGNCAASLVNEEMAAGNHVVNFDASYLSSGVYYYKLTAGKYSAIKKLVLLK